MILRHRLNTLWGLVAGIGIVLVLFSGISYTVQDPAECPATWEGDPVEVSEVFADDGSVAGYWCIANTGVTRQGDPKYLTLPIGEPSGYPAWYGFVPIALAAIGFGATRLVLGTPKDTDSTGVDDR